MRGMEKDRAMADPRVRATQSDSRWVECPTCHGVPQMQGDGHGYDDGGSYHTPPCETCGDRGEIVRDATLGDSERKQLRILKAVRDNPGMTGTWRRDECDRLVELGYAERQEYAGIWITHITPAGIEAAEALNRAPDLPRAWLGDASDDDA